MAARLPSFAVSLTAMFRFSVLSQVHVRVAAGQPRSEAIRQLIKVAHLGPDGRPRRVSRRSLYRWAASYHANGIRGLEPATRTTGTASRVLDASLVSFLVDQKQTDPRASVPELVRRAVQAGLLQTSDDVDRTTVWRALGRAGVSTQRAPRPPRDTRRFAMPHRLQLILCDGKQFYAGPARTSRVALFFIDDASRFVPYVVVGPSESANLFLRGLFGLLQRVGKIDAVYFDNGSGFIAHDSHEVMVNLETAFIHGAVKYPPARGKIERFNQTAEEDFLRSLARPGVDPDCTALELRIGHYLTHTYNTRAHSGLGGVAPAARYLEDQRALRPYEDTVSLRRKFVVRKERTVSNDHIIKFGGALYEVPRGLARQKVTVVRDAFDKADLHLEQEESWIRLHPVDLNANARARRGTPDAPPLEKPTTTVTTAAAAAADTALAPITQPDGGCAAEPEESEWT